MAFRRSLTARAKLFYQQQQQQRVAFPLSRVDRDDNDRRREDLQIHDLRRGGGGNASSFSLSGWRNSCGDRRFAAPAAFTPVYVRNMSSNGDGRAAENDVIVTDNLEMVNEAAEKAVEAVAPVMNEVAEGAMELFLPLINHVHTFTGCNWWASIALSAILLRTLTLPVMIHQARATYRLTPIYAQVTELKKLEEDYEKSGNEGSGEINLRLKKLSKEHGLNGTIVPTAITLSVGYMFCTAIFEMVRKVECFKDGGALWFTDLSTPDATLILPVLAAFTLWSTLSVELSKHDLSLRPCRSLTGVAVGVALTFPFIAFAPKGVLCYWIASNLFGVAYGIVMKNAEVKKMLGIPNVAEPPDLHGLVLPAYVHDVTVFAAFFSHIFLNMCLKN